MEWGKSTNRKQGKLKRRDKMDTPIEEKYITTAEASEILQIDEQVLRKLGQQGARGIYKIGKQYRFRLKEFETVSAELSENLDKLSQEVSGLETTCREMVDRFGLFDKATKQAQTEFYTMLRALEIMRGDIDEDV